MEKIIRTLLLAVMMTACCVTTNAQDKGKQRISREQLAETQARHIAQQLAFDDETTAKFVDTYSRCQKEVWSLAPRKRVGKGASKNDRETEEAIEERFDRSQKLLDIRKKYYKEYSKFLTPKQIQRVYSIEKNMMKRLGKNANRRKNIRP
jgi:vancomycin resistance protein YoaR